MWTRLIAFLVYLFAPFALIFGGAGLTSLGISYEWEIVAWTGAIITLAGLVWGIFLFMVHSE